MDETAQDLYRAKWTQAKREAYHKSHPENFAGPDGSYPIEDSNDVKDAWDLAGHADNPDAIRSKVKSIAKRLGLSDALPDTAKDKKASRSMDTELETQMYVPITRIDKEKWEVEGQATSDAIDHYETIFDYDSSKRAFEAWRGNVREMHNPNKAVGRAIRVEPDDETRTIAVRAFVSKGAPDTWQKVLDGTLSGFSIGVPAGKYKSKMVERNGKSVKMYYDHELAELSLVDNPGSPGCNIAVVRADGIATDVLDDSEETPVTQAEDVNRAGARISHVTQGTLHGMRDGYFQNLRQVLDLCACEVCLAICAILDPDGDGDGDFHPAFDLDGDGGTQDMMGGMNYNVEAAITRHMAPMITRVNAMLSSYASRTIPTYPQPQELSTEPLERRIADVERAFDTKLTEVRSVLTEVKELAVKIAAQPMPGGPVMTPVDKRLATSPQAGYTQTDDIAALQRASQLVPLSHEEQIKFAAEIFKQQNRG